MKILEISILGGLFRVTEYLEGNTYNTVLFVKLFGLLTVYKEYRVVSIKEEEPLTNKFEEYLSNNKVKGRVVGL